MIFSDAEIYAIARCLKGMDWQHLPVDPFLAHLLGNVKPDNTQQVKVLFDLLGTDVLTRVFAVDPSQMPEIVTPANSTVPQPAETIPDLPDHVKLTPAQVQAGAQVGCWLNDYVDWSGRTANQTPLLFHQAAGLMLGAMALGRRTYVHTPWGQKVFGNLYILIAALSTYYRKTTSLNLATQVARTAFPQRVLPEPGSPENFMSLLSDKLPSNFDSLEKAEQTRLLEISTIAAQRSIIRDELSGLFKSMGKDYMAGMKERVMQMFDCPDYLEFSSNGKGLVVVRNVAFSLFGASTPAELANTLSATDWQNGNLARFALLTPEPDYKERPRNAEYEEPTELVQRLKCLQDRLPSIPPPNSPTERPTGEEWSLVCHVWEQCDAYQEALRQMTAPGSTLDDRLRSNYGRFHIHALKIAMILAVMDWAEQPSPSTRPVVEPAHWYRAMQITETWRASAHRLLHEVSDNTYSQTEAKILGYLGHQPAGSTKSALLRYTHLKSRDLDEALMNLIDAGVIIEAQQQRGRGPAARVYQLV